LKKETEQKVSELEKKLTSEDKVVEQKQASLVDIRNQAEQFVSQIADLKKQLQV
jgi:chromosome segregation ATPase